MSFLLKDPVAVMRIISVRYPIDNWVFFSWALIAERTFWKKLLFIPSDFLVVLVITVSFFVSRDLIFVGHEAKTYFHQQPRARADPLLES